MTEIAKFTNSDKAAVTRVINSLVADGWLNRKNGSLDRRQIYITLSAKGLRNILRIEKTYGKIANCFASALKSNEQKVFFKLLSKVEATLTSENNKNVSEFNFES